VNVERKHPTGLLQPHAFMESKWEVISRDFIVGIVINDKEARIDCCDS